MLSHLFGKKDSPCIANCSLKQSVKNEAKIIQEIVKKIYIDDFLNSLPNEINLINIKSKITTILNTYGFRVTKFVSISPTVLKSLPSSEISPKFVNLDLGSDASERTLVLIWNINTDELSIKPVTKIFPETKRGILSIISTVCHPLGIHDYTPLKQLLPESPWINGPSLLYQSNTKTSENEISNLPHEFTT